MQKLSSISTQYSLSLIHSSSTKCPRAKELGFNKIWETYVFNWWMVKEKISKMGFIAINKIEKFLSAVESSFRDCKFRIGCMHLKMHYKMD